MLIAPNKQRAINALLAGASNQDAARAAGVAPATLCRWKHQPDFGRELSDGQAALANAAQSDLAALREKAIGAIDDALDNEEVNIRLRAAALVMPRSGAQISVSATTNANSTAAIMPELSMEEVVANILAGPRTLMRAIDAGMVPNTSELRAQIQRCADDWATALTTAREPSKVQRSELVTAPTLDTAKAPYVQLDKQAPL